MKFSSDTFFFYFFFPQLSNGLSAVRLAARVFSAESTVAFTLRVPSVNENAVQFPQPIFHAFADFFLKEGCRLFYNCHAFPHKLFLFNSGKGAPTRPMSKAIYSVPSTSSPPSFRSRNTVYWSSQLRSGNRITASDFL